ncbi:MAG: hypothetical protein BJ554DRAFT_6957, partial [Olpidium bornovanus]
MKRTRVSSLFFFSAPRFRNGCTPERSDSSLSPCASWARSLRSRCVRSMHCRGISDACGRALTVLCDLIWQMPVWSVLLCVFLSAFFTLPTGFIVSVIGQVVHLNVLTEFIIGLIIPGKTVTVMAFKSLGVNVQNQALALLS